MTKLSDKLLKFINDEDDVHRILMDFAFKWFMFGVLVGATVGVLIESLLK